MSTGINETSDAAKIEADDTEAREAAAPAVVVTGPRTAPRLPANRNVG